MTRALGRLALRTLTPLVSILGLWYLAFLISAFCFAFSTSGVFYVETQKSTLGFLLATPMSTWPQRVL